MQRFRLVTIFKVFCGAVLAALVSVAFLDQKLALFFDLEKNQGLKRFGKLITDIGLAEHYFIISIVGWIGFAFLAKKFSGALNTKFDFYKRWSINFFIGLIASGILVHLFKNLIGRARPHQTESFDPFVFKPVNFDWSYQSMPSGHSQVMFTAATFFAVAFPKWKYFWFAFAVLICFSRVMVHDHFLSDTIMGAFTGWLGAHLTLQALKPKALGLKELDSPS